jgi:hypothetical protein
MWAVASAVGSVWAYIFFRYLLFMVLASMTVSVDRVFFVLVSHVPVAATY